MIYAYIFGIIWFVVNYIFFRVLLINPYIAFNLSFMFSIWFTTVLGMDYMNKGLSFFSINKKGTTN